MSDMNKILCDWNSIQSGKCGETAIHFTKSKNYIAEFTTLEYGSKSIYVYACRCEQHKIPEVIGFYITTFENFEDLIVDKIQNE